MRCRPTHLAWERGAQSGREGLGPGAWWGWRKRGKAGEGEELKSGVLGAAGRRGGEASHRILRSYWNPHRAPLNPPVPVGNLKDASFQGQEETVDQLLVSKQLCFPNRGRWVGN